MPQGILRESLQAYCILASACDFLHYLTFWAQSFLVKTLTRSPKFSKSHSVIYQCWAGKGEAQPFLEASDNLPEDLDKDALIYAL